MTEDEFVDLEAQGTDAALADPRIQEAAEDCGHRLSF
jgi:hypothetical protein